MSNSMKIKRLLSVMLMAVILVSALAWSLSFVAAATPPLVPFDSMGDLYVLDSRSGSVLRIDAAENISIAVSEAEITAVTGESSADFRQAGIAFDAAGTLYFADNASHSILKKPLDGSLSLLVSAADITSLTGSSSADPEGLAFGSDGMLYVNDDGSDSVLQVDPATGDVGMYVSEQAMDDVGGISTVGVDSGIIGAEGGVLFVASDGNPDAMFKIDASASPSVTLHAPQTAPSPFGDMLEGFMTRDMTGTLYIADPSQEKVFTVSPSDGSVSDFLTTAQISDTAGTAMPNTVGGIAFDTAGRFYLGEDQTDAILRFENQGGTWQGEIWITEEQLSDATGELDATLNGGMAFAPTAAADLALQKEASATAEIGDTITYTLTVSNAGPAEATDVTVVDTLPPEVSFVSASSGCAESGGTVTCDLGSLAATAQAQVNITVQADATGTASNSASVSATQTDPDSENNDDSANTAIGAAADLALQKEASAAVEVGDTIVYTLTVSNAGPSEATDVTVVDTLPSEVSFVSASSECAESGGTVTCDLGSLAATAQAQVNVTVRADATGTASNSASVSANETDPVSDNNDDSADTTVDERHIYLPLILKE